MTELLERNNNKNYVESVVRECHNDWILSCAWSDSQPLVATAGLDCTVKVWDVDHRCAPVGTFTHHSAAVLSVAFQVPFCTFLHI